MSARARRLSSTSRSRWNRVVWSTAVIASTVPFADAWAEVSVDMNREVAFSIPSQPLDAALIEFSRQADVQLAISAPALQYIQSPGIKGKLPANTALSKLLSHTELKFYTVGNTIAVAPAAVHSSADAMGTTASASSDEEAQRPRSEQRSMVLSAGGGQVATQRPQMDEVLVTAQKREERLQDVPVPVTAIGGEGLAQRNQLRLQDYFSSVPGLSVAPGISSNQVLAIRGVATGLFTNPTVGIAVDDVPYGSSTYLGGGQVVPDLDPGDLARVEVLRGPQGTLYGASSMGGLLKYVTVDPSTRALTARIEAGTNHIQNGSDPGYNVRGSVNVPINDELAVRASAFTRLDTGYINNPFLNVDGINKARASGGRLSALWSPLTDFSLKLSALYQDYKSDGSNDVNVGAGLGDLQQNYLPGIGAFDRRAQAYSAIIKAKLGSVDLTSVSGYNINSFSESFDYTYGLSSYTEPLFGVSGTPEFNQNKTDKFTQEVRLNATAGTMIDWLVGGFYTHEKSSYSQTLRAEDTTTFTYVGDPDVLSFPTTFQEIAGFADVTFHVSSQLDVQIGGRESQIRQSVNESEVGPYVPSFWYVPSPFIAPEQSTKTSAFTYLVTPRFKLTPDLMIYARLASGYRAGGPNAAPGAPHQYNPDKTLNYELGFKGDLADHKLTLDASAYYISWKDIQLSFLTPDFFGYNGNGSRAKSQGIELSADAKPIRGLNLSAWVDFSDAELTEAIPVNNAVGEPGDRLPYSSRFSGNFSIQQDFPITEDVSGFVGGAASYVGKREGEFATIFSVPPQRQLYPAYTKVDVRAGVIYGTWTGSLYANNVTDRRAPLSGGLGAYPPTGFTYIQPRSVGLSVAKTF